MNGTSKIPRVAVTLGGEQHLLYYSPAGDRLWAYGCWREKDVGKPAHKTGAMALDPAFIELESVSDDGVQTFRYRATISYK